jgi:hypothetical protein
MRLDLLDTVCALEISIQGNANTRFAKATDKQTALLRLVMANILFHSLRTFERTAALGVVTSHWHIRKNRLSS